MVSFERSYGELPEWIATTVAPLARHPEFVDLRVT
jgi:hypothetical protein